MDVRIKATGCELSPHTSAYAEERLAHLEKMLGGDADGARCEVELGRDAGRPRHGEHVWFAEIQMIVPGNSLIRATNRASSLNAAIDDAQAEAARQLRRERKLHIRLWRKSGNWAKRLMRRE